MKVIVIIVTYNGGSVIRKCLKSVFKSSIPLDVLVIDNCSSDETLQIAGEFLNITILDQDKNLGFGKANNLGISYAIQQAADYVFLLNQDAFINTDTIEKLIQAHKNHIDFGILSPLHLNGKGNALDLNFSNYLLKNQKLIFDAFQGHFSKDVYKLPFVNAAGWLLPIRTVNLVGGFDPIFFHYGEDVNYCHRVLYHGLKIGVVPTTTLRHAREERKTIEFMSEDQKLLIEERKFKTMWSDINEPCELIIKNHRKILRRRIIKLFLQLKLKSLRLGVKEFRLIKKIEADIYKSRAINMKQGPHYIDQYIP